MKDRYFYRNVDTDSREAMVKFLKEHFRYSTMNTWNRSTSYANCVKIHRMDLPEKIMERAWDYISGELEVVDFDFMWEDLKYQFLVDNGYAVGFNGASDGYLVLYEAKIEKDKDGRTSYGVYLGRNIDMYEEFDEEDWTMDELKARVQLVQNFDAFCDDMRDAFIYILSNANEVEEEEIKVIKHRKLSIMEE